MTLIHIAALSRHYMTPHRRERLGGTLQDLFSGSCRTVEAVTGISFDIEAGGITGYIVPDGAGNPTKIDPCRIFCAAKESLL